MAPRTDLLEFTAAGRAPEAELLATARGIIAAAEATDGVPPVSDQAMLAAARGERALIVFAAPGARPGTEPGATPGDAPHGADALALGIIGDGELDLVVRPEARGRGVGARALAALLARHRPADGPLRAWAHGTNPAADALLEAAGFVPVRSLFRMALDPALLPADGRDPLALAPAGLGLHRFGAEPGDSAAWVRVNAAAFATHPEQGRMTEADLAQLAAEPWFDAADLILLTDARGEAIGSTWVKTLRDPETDARDTELYALAVHPEHAGRRLGSLLLDVTLARMAEHAPRSVTLYVDGENERAVRLYERAGFTVDSRSRQWETGAGDGAGARMDA